MIRRLSFLLRFWVTSSSLDVLVLSYFFLPFFLLSYFLPFLHPYANYYETEIFFVVFLGNHFLTLNMVEYLGQREIGQILELRTCQSLCGSFFRNDVLKVWSVFCLLVFRHWNRAEQLYLFSDATGQNPNSAIIFSTFQPNQRNLRIIVFSLARKCQLFSSAYIYPWSNWWRGYWKLTTVTRFQKHSLHRYQRGESWTNTLLDCSSTAFFCIPPHPYQKLNAYRATWPCFERADTVHIYISYGFSFKCKYTFPCHLLRAPTYWQYYLITKKIYRVWTRQRIIQRQRNSMQTPKHVPQAFQDKIFLLS